MAESLDRAGAALAASAPITLAQRMAAYEVLRSIAEADLAGTPRPKWGWDILDRARFVVSVDFDMPANEAYVFIRDSVAGQIKAQRDDQLTLEVA